MKRYQPLKLFWLTIVLATLGVVCFLYFFADAIPFWTAGKLTPDNLGNVKSGRYVKITFDQCVVGKYGSVRGTLGMGPKTYQIIPVAFGEDKYLEIGFANASTIRALQKYQNGRGKALSVVAKVQYNQTYFQGQDLRWYENTAVDAAQVVTEFLFLEMSSLDFLIPLLAGTALTAAAALCFLTVGGIRVVYETPFEDTRAYKECAYGRIINVEWRIEREKATLAELYRQQEETGTTMRGGIAVGIFGIFIIGCGFVILMGVFRFPFTIAGVFVIIWGLKVWKDGFLNSNHPVAYRISKIFMQHTTSIKIEETEKLISALQSAKERQDKERRTEDEKPGGDKLELRRINRKDVYEQWEYTTNLPEDENGLTNSNFGVSLEEYKQEVLPKLISYEDPVDMPDWFVPETYYYLWKGDCLVGEFRIRHYLTEALKKGAGHIGYSIKYEYRGRGYATKGLALALEIAKKIVPEDEIYLRVQKSNMASLRVMEKNGAWCAGEDKDHFLMRIKR